MDLLAQAAPGDGDAIVEVRAGIAFANPLPPGGREELPAVVRFRKAAHDVRVPVIGDRPGGPRRAPILRVKRGGVLKVTVFGATGAPVCTAALDLAGLGDTREAERVVVRGAPAFCGAPAADVVFEARPGR